MKLVCKEKLKGMTREEQGQGKTSSAQVDANNKKKGFVHVNETPIKTTMGSKITRQNRSPITN